MEIDRNDLMEVLNWLKPGIASKEFLEQSNHYILNKEEILSYNGDISVACPFDIGVECTVDASLFYKLLNRMDKDTVDISLDKTTLVVECGNVKAELPTVIASEIFAYINKLGVEQNDLEWHDVPEDFLEAIRLCAFSASTDKTLGTLTCLWVEGEDVLSTDKYRASWYKMKSAVTKNFYVEAMLISELLKFAKPVEYCLSDSWIHFALETGVMFSARLVTPDKLLPVRDKFNEFKHDVRIELPAALTEAVGTVSIAVESVEKLDQLVKIEFGEELIRCSGYSQRGKVYQDIHLNNPLKITPFTIEASPISLLEVLGHATHFLVSKNQGLFKSTEARGFQHLIGIIKDD